MILADTSVWIDHLRTGVEELTELLADNEIVCHPFVVGELACGNLSSRESILKLLRQLPQAARASDSEVLHCIEARRLMGRGIGLVDAHLIASSLLDSGTRLWTLDRRLRAVAQHLGVAFEWSR